MPSQKFTLNKSNDIMWQYSVFFWLRHISHLVNNHFVTVIDINEIVVADPEEAYSNTKDGNSCENSNVIDLLTKKH